LQLAPRLGAAAVVGVTIAAVALFAFVLAGTRDARRSDPSAVRTRTSEARQDLTENRPQSSGISPPLFARAAPRGVFQTLRISGPDLPYPVVVTPVEYFLATNTSADAFNSWWVADNQNPPAAGGPRYSLELAYLDSSQSVVETEPLYVYVPGARPLVGEGSRWREPSIWFAGLIDRYIELGRSGQISTSPSLSEVLSASAQALGLEVSLGEVRVDSDTFAQRTLTTQEGLNLLDELGSAQVGVFGMRGHLLGQKGYLSIEINIEFGGFAGPRFFYMLPGSMAPYGMGIAPRNLGAWGYSPAASPPIYTQRVLMLPRSLDAELHNLGYPGRTLTDVVDYRMEPLSQAQTDSSLTSGVSVWAQAHPDRKVRFAGDLCRSGCDILPAPVTLPLGGPRYIVQIEYAGLDPYPEDIQQPLYDYYPAEQGCSAMVQTRALRMGGGSFPLEAPFCAPAEVDDILRSAISQLN
jgi:hypothetical protein